MVTVVSAIAAGATAPKITAAVAIAVVNRVLNFTNILTSFHKKLHKIFSEMYNDKYGARDLLPRSFEVREKRYVCYAELFQTELSQARTVSKFIMELSSALLGTQLQIQKKTF